MGFRLVIFDYDGTLADSGQWFLDNVNVFAARHKFRPVTADNLEALRAMSTRQVVKALGVKPWRLPFIARDMRRAVAQQPGATAALFPGIAELLARVEAARIPIAVVSSNSLENIRRGLGESAALVSAFDGGASLFGKTRKLRRIAKAFGVRGADVLCVGDDSRDIESAHAAGLKVAAVAWGYAREEALAAAGPDFLVRDVEELARAIGV